MRLTQPKVTLRNVPHSITATTGFVRRNFFMVEMFLHKASVPYQPLRCTVCVYRDFYCRKVVCVMDFAKSTRNTMNISEPKYTLCNVPHSLTTSPSPTSPSRCATCATGLLTPTFKAKRPQLKQRFATELAAMYAHLHAQPQAPSKL